MTRRLVEIAAETAQESYSELPGMLQNMFHGDNPFGQFQQGNLIDDILQNSVETQASPAETPVEHNELPVTITLDASNNYTADLGGFNIFYGGRQLLEVSLSAFVRAIFGDLDMMVDQIGMVSFVPSWSRLPGDGITIGGNWNHPGLENLRVQNTDENVIELLTEDPLTGESVGRGGGFLIAANPGEAYIQLVLSGHEHITIQTKITVAPRSMPAGFVITPHTVRVAPGEFALVTISTTLDDSSQIVALPFHLEPDVISFFAFASGEAMTSDMGEFSDWPEGQMDYVFGVLEEFFGVSVFDLHDSPLIGRSMPLLIRGNELGSTNMTLRVLATDAGGELIEGVHVLEVLVTDEEEGPGGPQILADELTITPLTATNFTGTAMQFRAEISPANVTSSALQWSSSDPRVARVIDPVAGVVSFASPGTATITARTTDGSNLEATATVTVRQRFVQSIALSRETELIHPGDTLELTATAMPVNATNRNLAVTVSDPSVLSFENGVVTGVSAGAVDIIATAQDGSGVSGRRSINITAATGAVTINYRANGGTGTVASQTVTTPGSVALRANAFSRAGFRFGGWRCNQTHSIWRAGETISWSGTNTGTWNLDATWVSTGGHRDPGRHMERWYTSALVPLRTGIEMDVPGVGLVPTWLSAMQSGISNWNNSSANVSFDSVPVSNNYIIVIYDTQEDYLGWHTAINYSGSQVTTFSLTLNSSAITGAWGMHTLNQRVTQVMMHELGHAIGLEDNPNTSSATVMVEIPRFTVILTPPQFDINSVNLLYR